MRFAEGGHIPIRGQADSTAYTLPPVDLKVGALYPNRAERIIRSLMHVVAIITMLLVSLLMALLLTTAASIADRLGEVDPAPAVTGCPFGEGQCGG